MVLYSTIIILRFLINISETTYASHRKSDSSLRKVLEEMNDFRLLKNFRKCHSFLANYCFFFLNRVVTLLRYVFSDLLRGPAVSLQTVQRTLNFARARFNSNYIQQLVSSKSKNILFIHLFFAALRYAYVALTWILNRRSKIFIFLYFQVVVIVPIRFFGLVDLLNIFENRSKRRRARDSIKQ